MTSLAEKRQHKLKRYKIKALLYARDLIESGKEEYICFAIYQYLYSFHHKDTTAKLVREACQYLKDYIAQNLDAKRDGLYKAYETKSLDEWLIEKGHINQLPKTGDAKMIQTRLNWIDWMLKHYHYKVTK